MKIYTRGGDTGQTALFGGARVSKSHPRVRAYGAIDALNVAIGYAYSDQGMPSPIRERLFSLMNACFDLGAEIACDPSEKARQMLGYRLNSSINKNLVQSLENWIDEAEEPLEPLKAFVLPTGCEAACRLHMAREKTRFAEQELCALQENGADVAVEQMMFINRLSDLFFVWSRAANAAAGQSDILWQKQA